MKMRIGAQLACSVAIPIVASGLLMFAIFIGTGALRGAKDDLSAKTSLRMHVADIERQVELSRSATLDYVLTHDKSNATDQAQALVTARRDVAYAMHHAALVPGKLAEIQNIANQLGANEIHSVRLIRLADIDNDSVLGAFRNQKTGSYADAYLQESTVDTTSLRLDGLLEALITTVDLAEKASSDSFDTLVEQIDSGMLIAEIITIGCTLMVSFAFARRMAKRLERVSLALADVVREDFAALSGALVRLAAGDLRGSFSSTRKPLADMGGDEIADVARSYDALAAGLGKTGSELTAGLTRLRELIAGVVAASANMARSSGDASTSVGSSTRAVEQIAIAVDRVANGARDQAERINEATDALEELARAAEQIAGVASHQAASLGATAAALQQLDDGIESLSSHGGVLTSSARDASSETASGNAAVEQTQVAMRRLHEVSALAATAMQTLEQRSAQVEEIVSTIEEIADQTNLLALNAAIEAARAGAHGRGFAVVADEVRKLAERSSSATKQISSILSSIRSETVSAASAMRTSRDSMQTGLSVAEQAARSLASVGAAIRTTTSVAEDLAGRASQMRDASLNVTQNMSTASAAVEENALAASEMRSTTMHITQTMVPIAVTATEQSDAAQHAAAAANELAAGIDEIDATARALRDQAAALEALVAQFVMNDPAGAAVDPSSAEHRAPAGERSVLTAAR